MQFTIERDQLLKPLQLVTSVVEKKQTLPILSNVLIEVKKNEINLIGTDSEIELRAKIPLDQPAKTGAITVPAQKLTDICRNLPEKATLNFILEEPKLLVQAGRSRFSLNTLPAANFPATEITALETQFVLPHQELKTLLEKTHFAMAERDVRYYLNGILLDIKDTLSAVATDGHRMALSFAPQSSPVASQIILPRKTVFELQKLLSENAGEVQILFSATQLRATVGNYTFTTKLIDGRFPNYQKVLPTLGDKTAIIDCNTLKKALARVAVLVNEKNRGIWLALQKNTLKIFTHNLDQDQAEEEIDVVYQAEPIEMGFNVTYLLDALNALPEGEIKFNFSDPNKSIRIESSQEGSSIYVVAPMQL